MPEVLHNQKGLRIVQNDLNRFTVVTLHYTADPAKRSDAWRTEAAAGMNPAMFAKEYDMDYSALYGARVFPEFALHKSTIVVPDSEYQEFGPTQVFWGGFDFGSRNPSAFYVFTMIEGVIHVVWELYEPARTIPDLCQKILACPYYPNIKYIASDPTIIQQKTRTNRFGQFVTISELMGEYGIRKLIAGHTDESTWLAIMRKHWAMGDDPTFRIWARCPNLIREFENAIFQNQSQKELLTQTYKESMEDVNNHGMDAVKYFCNSRPTTTVYTRKDPRMWQRWMK